MDTRNIACIGLHKRYFFTMEMLQIGANLLFKGLRHIIFPFGSSFVFFG